MNELFSASLRIERSKTFKYGFMPEDDEVVEDEDELDEDEEETVTDGDN